MPKAKTPTKIKRIRGTDRKDREVENEMQFESIESAPCPAHLKKMEYGEAIWDDSTDELSKLGMLHKADLQLLAAYCVEMSHYWSCQDLIERADSRVYPVKNKEGQVVQLLPLPYFRLATQHLGNATKIAGKFGFSPSDRTAISMPKKAIEAKNPFLALKEKYK